MAIIEKKYVSKKTGKEISKYYACVYNPMTGKHIWGKGREKRKNAVKDEADILEDIEKGTTEAKGKMKFKDLAKLWFDSTETTYAESTWRGYKGYYNAKLAPVFDEVYVNKITPTHVQMFKNELSKKYKPATVNKTLNLLSMMMDYAIKPLNIIKYNPCKDIKRDKIETPEHTTWDEQTIGYFLNLESVVNSDYYEMLVLSFTTGLRPGEVCGVSTKSLKKDNLLSLFRGYNKYGNITDMKTPGSHRPIALDPFVYNILKQKLEKKKKQKEEYTKKYLKGKVPTPYKDNDFLFTYEDGTPITPNSYSRAFRNLIRNHNSELKKIEAEKGKLPPGLYYLPQVRLYDCRHSFATNNILSGENAKTVAEIMGSRVETIMRNYVHVGRTTHQATLSKYSGKIFNFNEITEKNNTVS